MSTSESAGPPRFRLIPSDMVPRDEVWAVNEAGRQIVPAPGGYEVRTRYRIVGRIVDVRQPQEDVAP